MCGRGIFFHSFFFIVDQPNLQKCSRKMAFHVNGNIQSNMGKNIGVDATLTFDPQGHLPGHKVETVFNIIWLAIAGENAQQRRPTLLHNS